MELLYIYIVHAFYSLYRFALNFLVSFAKKLAVFDKSNVSLKLHTTLTCLYTHFIELREWIWSHMDHFDVPENFRVASPFLRCLFFYICNSRLCQRNIGAEIFFRCSRRKSISNQICYVSTGVEKKGKKVEVGFARKFETNRIAHMPYEINSWMRP